jgi:hypothetical protein
MEPTPGFEPGTFSLPRNCSLGRGLDSRPLTRATCWPLGVEMPHGPDLGIRQHVAGALDFRSQLTHGPGHSVRWHIALCSSGEARERVQVS